MLIIHWFLKSESLCKIKASTYLSYSVGNCICYVFITISQLTKKIYRYYFIWLSSTLELGCYCSHITDEQSSILRNSMSFLRSASFWISCLKSHSRFWLQLKFFFLWSISENSNGHVLEPNEQRSWQKRFLLWRS